MSYDTRPGGSASGTSTIGPSAGVMVWPDEVMGAGDELWVIPGQKGIDGSQGGVGHSFLGYNTIGGSIENMTLYRVYAKKITMPADGWLTSIDAYIDAGSLDDTVGGLAASVMTDASGTPDRVQAASQPRDTAILLDSISGAGGNTTARWFQIAMNTWLTAGDYWICVQAGSNGAGGTPIRIRYDATGSDRFYSPGSYWFADWGWYGPTTSGNQYSIRASVASPGGAIGPAGPAGVGTQGPATYLEAEAADEPWIIPGPQGLAGVGIAGPMGPNGPAVYLEADVIEPDFFVVPGPMGPRDTTPGPAGPAVFLEADVIEPDFFVVPGKDGAKGADGAPGGGGGGGVSMIPYMGEAEDAYSEAWPLAASPTLPPWIPFIMPLNFGFATTVPQTSGTFDLAHASITTNSKILIEPGGVIAGASGFRDDLDVIQYRVVKLAAGFAEVHWNSVTGYGACSDARKGGGIKAHGCIINKIQRHQFLFQVA